MFEEKKSVRWVKLALALLSVDALVSAPAQAQDAANKPEGKIERVEITGSNIKRLVQEGVSPMTLISKEDILRSGATSVLDVLRNLPAVGGNGREFGGGNDFRNGATTASLRGMPTLILLNGNRLPVSGSDDSNGFTSVDLNMLPLAAIERIEVLKDGASAIYGTDAVGGVINFIMRQNYQGTDLSASYGTTTLGGGDVAKLSIAGGFGDRATQKFNLTYAAMVEDTKRIKGTDRDWANHIDFGARGGLQFINTYGAHGTDPGTLSIGGNRFADPECAAGSKLPYPSGAEWFPSPTRNGCLSAAAEYTDLVKPSTRFGATAALNWDLAPDLSLFANAFYTNFEKRIVGQSSWLQNRARSNLVIPASNPFNTYGKPVTVRRDFPVYEGGIKTKVENIWLLAGLKGELAGWDWSATFSHGEEQGRTDTLGAYKLEELNQAVDAGRFNPFGVNKNSAALIAELSGQMYVNTRSKSDSLKLQASAELGELPGGKVGVSVGGELRKNALSFTPSQDWQQGLLGQYAVLPPISGSEKLSAVYAELSLPLLKTLEAQAALRHDKYELAGSTTNPKLGLKWAPSQTVMLRANYSTGMVAPSLPQRFSEGRDAFYGTKDPHRCVEGDVYFDAYCSRYVKVSNVGTKGLQPEKSNQYNLGFVVAPVKDLSIGMTYFDIKWKNKIDILDNRTVLDNEDGAYQSHVTRKPVSAEDAAAYATLSAADKARLGPLRGELANITTGWVNRFESHTSGIDVDASYTFRTRSLGNIKVFGEATYTLRYDTVLLANNVYINCPNNTSCDAGEYGNPRLLANLGVNWDLGPWSGTGIVKYVAGTKVDRAPSTVHNQWYDFYAKGARIPAIATLDASLAYAGFKNLVIRAGANNVFNRDPAFDPSSALGYNDSWGDPRGRYVYASLNYAFK
ncbi:TonB-dependent receptor [Rugamonas sp. CCM 8940]|uniref:TonB-dependent receptor n=1 Tax=Rugamonas sp. CCM 8940 TaxID=2765359 RepID=UPI0018F5D33A|nr:TonB-dependent receptor [Rugamonas sp. CCM 8940]MBJ7312128.1 TonB-dependent receptor [Rugamonas sp. CCM 8940]